MPGAEYVLPAISFIVGLNAQPVGLRLDVIDHPFRGHKTHREVTPLVGGIAAALLLLTYCTLFWRRHPERLGHAVLAFGIGGVFLSGFIDDRKPLLSPGSPSPASVSSRGGRQGPNLNALVFVRALRPIEFARCRAT